MLTDDVRARLRRVYTTALGGSARAAAIDVAGGTPNVARAPAPPPSDWLARGCEVENSSGKHLRLRRPLTDYWPHAATVVARLGAWPPSQTGDEPVPAAHPELAMLADHFPQRAIFLDLETCGFAGSTVFLVGLVWQAQEELIVDQLLARDYAEERAMLETLWRVLETQRVLVTFNGKSFDWPMLRDRTARHRLNGPEPTRDPGGREPWLREWVHCDLLHHARRRWKRLLPDCRLQTLERYVCRRWRREDLSGAQVPAAYHEFVRFGHTRRLGAILRHNALDLATLVELAARLAGAPR